ncbi:Uu.00g137930.m01.CDS01 [Anthostomella pinea]|uniref:Uu.00g137930.m01.CDS01 n=1 Tax=Anthostomella pinea TaxID=933095 RepID=A0AAI8VPM9_9PEZI|nr:Uu.00g137930.m01.CDS01 [Anthostomella pinea]
MHWSSLNMLQVMELSKLEAQYPHIINEGTSQEFLHKVKTISALWAKKNPT